MFWKDERPLPVPLWIHNTFWSSLAVFETSKTLPLKMTLQRESPRNSGMTEDLQIFYRLRWVRWMGDLRPKKMKTVRSTIKHELVHSLGKKLDHFRLLCRQARML